MSETQETTMTESTITMRDVIGRAIFDCDGWDGYQDSCIAADAVIAAIAESGHEITPMTSKQESQNALAVKPSQAAEMLGISRTKLFELLATGELPSFLAGKRLRLIRVSAIDAYMAAQESGDDAMRATR